ncbi:MAG: hypothetical protein IT376_01915 [Polyangiaceae bacterium]|nr:hypothetical protein [Polyangiaceae bacterium]
MDRSTSKVPELRDARRARRWRAPSHAALAIACFAVAGQPGPARAQGADKAAAEALFDEGLALLKAGKLTEACAKLEGSQRLDAAVGTLLYLGECYEKSGRLASAWATFREAASAARAAGQTARARQGQERADRLEPRLSRLALDVPDAVKSLPGFVLERDGAPVAPALYGVPVPVDAGERKLVARAAGHAEWTSSAKVEGEGKTTRVAVPALERLPEPPPAERAVEPAPPPPPRAAAPAAPPPRAPEADAGTSQRTWGWVAGGVGLVGVGIGTVFGLRALSRNAEAEDECPRGDVCDTRRGVELTEEAKDAAFVSNVAVGLGAVALAGGVVLWLTAPSAPEQVAVEVRPSTGGATLGLGGRF